MLFSRGMTGVVKSIFLCFCVLTLTSMSFSKALAFNSMPAVDPWQFDRLPHDGNMLILWTASDFAQLASGCMLDCYRAERPALLVQLT